MLLTLETSLQFVKGIGPRSAHTLQEKRITTIEDLLYHLPFRYEDRLRPQAIEELVPGEMASLIGEVRGMALLLERRLQGSMMGSNRFRIDIPRLVDMYRDGRLLLDELISGRIKLDEINDGYEALKENRVTRSVIVV